MNDLCTSAEPIVFPALPACPQDASATVSLSGDNLGANPSDPFIRLATADGALLNAPVADVWYQLEAPANHIDIQLESTSLAQPTLALFRGGCNERVPIALSQSAPGAGTAVLSAELEPGQPYLLLVSGKSLDEQGEFQLGLTAFNDCSSCGRRRAQITASPAPVNGTYQAGEEVTFCLTPTLWDPGLALEWLHSVELEFGEGWALDSLQALPPASCSGSGQWAYYDSWESCSTGEQFGPGFAFDAAQGLLCSGGSPLDGDPGNNFGDGPCPGIEAAPLDLEFCWTVRVREEIFLEEEQDLNIRARMLGDGYAGSWMPFSCDEENSATLLARAVPTGSMLPAATVLSGACPGACNGQLFLQGGNAQQYLLIDESGAVLYTGSGTGMSDTLTGLCAGAYLLKIEEGNMVQTTAVEVPERILPEGQVGYVAPCSTSGMFQLITALSDPTADAEYSWSGPNGFQSLVPNPQVDQEGLYELIVTVGDCDLAPLQLQVKHRLPEVSCSASSEAVTFSWVPGAQDTAYQVNVLSGQSGTFLTATTYRVDGLAPGEEVAIELRALGTGICAVRSVEQSCAALICTPPEVSDDQISCAGTAVPLTVDAAAGAVVQWSPAAGLSCTDCATPVASPGATTNYTVNVTAPDGCQTTQTVTVYVDELPGSALPDTALTFCAGEPFSFCLPEGPQYLWISPIGFIRTGNCLNYPITNGSVAGTYKIRVRLDNGCRFFDELQLAEGEDCGDEAIGGAVSNHPGLTADLSEELLEVFPNPAQSQFTVSTELDGEKMLILYDGSGRQLQSWKMEGQHESFSLSEIPAGLYVLKIESDQGVRDRRLLSVKR